MFVISNKEKLEMHFQLYLLNYKDYLKNSSEVPNKQDIEHLLLYSNELLEAFLQKNKVTVEDEVQSMLHEMLDKLNRLGYLPDVLTKDFHK
tara:strand:- start:444 stop:716 length:273 start_codon:yes stop_codon:yes gene_type:complete